MSLYADSFQNARPHATYQSLSRRLNSSKSFNASLQAYIHELVALEEGYIQGLSRLGQRMGGPGGVFEGATGEAQKAIKQALELELAERARVHSVWKGKVKTEVEAPIRELSSKNEWRSYDRADQQVAGIVREYEATQEKVQKAQGKSTKSSSKSNPKLLALQSSLSGLGSQLTGQLPLLLSSGEAADTLSSNVIKECLVRLGTANADLGKELAEAGESIVVATLGVDEQTDREGWAIRESERLSSGQGGAGGFSPSGLAAGGVSEFGARNGSVLSIPNEPSSPAAETFARPAPPAPAPIPLPTPQGKEKSSSGFKLSSVFKRDRASSSAKEKEGYNQAPSSRFLPSTEQLPRPSAYTSPSFNNDRASIASSAQADDPLGSLGGSAQASRMQAPIIPEKKANKRDSLMPFSSGSGGGGGLFRRPSKVSSPRTEDAPVLPTPAVAGASEDRDRDEDGFMKPPEGYDRPIGDGAAENLMDSDSDDDLPTAKPLALSLAPPTAATGSAESETERLAALEKMKSTLLSSKPAGAAAGVLGLPAAAAAAPGVARRGTTRRRDVKSAVFLPGAASRSGSTDSAGMAALPESSSLPSSLATAGAGPTSSSPTSSGFLPGAVQAPSQRRANSILSSMSSQLGTGGAVIEDPFEGASTPGVRAVVSEVVNVLLGSNGEVKRVMITGEVGVSWRSAAGGAPVKLRLTGASDFEKTAPNLALVKQVGDDFELLPALEGGHTQTVFRYQLRLPASANDWVPLLLSTQTKAEKEKNLVSVIVSFSPNAGAGSKYSKAEDSPFGEEEDEDEELPLQAVTVFLSAGGPVATFQAKPSATFQADKNRLQFALDPAAVKSKAGGKLLARLYYKAETGTPESLPPVLVEWTIPGRTAGKVGVSVDGAELVETRRGTATGKYLVGVSA